MSTMKLAIFICSFDHDGLGRYGDPINPWGDLLAMQTVQRVLYEGGHLFLTVPIGVHIYTLILYNYTCTCTAA